MSRRDCCLLDDLGLSVKFCPAYLPGVEVNSDHKGCSSRVRPSHCTQVGLTSTITPNEGNSNAQFLIVGTAYALSLFSLSFS